MRRSRQVGLALVAAVACRAAPVPEADAAGAEMAAARHMLAADPALGTGRVYLDDVFAAPGTAPGARTARRRPAARSRRLADALGAPAARAPVPSALYLLLSDPLVAGDSASVSATAVFPTGATTSAALGYETLALTLRWRAGAWRVERAVQLGIS